MPIPRKLLSAAFDTLTEKRLRDAAEHCEIRGRKSASREELCRKLGWDSINFASFAWHMTVPELRKVCRVFGLKSTGLVRDDLLRLVQGFESHYDSIAKAPTYKHVFSNTAAKSFRKQLNEWLDARRAVLRPSELSKGEKTLWNIRAALMDINGDGFIGLFEGNTKKQVSSLVRDFRTIRADATASALEEIAGLLFEGPIPTNENGRRDALLALELNSKKLHSTLKKCDKLWAAADKDIPKLCVKFAADNPHVFQ